jgi:hypothetical protein
MTIDIQLRPEEEHALLDRARQSGQGPAEYVQKLIRDDIQSHPGSRKGGETCARESTIDDFIDHEFVAYCEREADDSVTLEEVLATTSKMKDSMARVIIEEERADRF